MSARPRPVTATFIPPSMAPPTGVRTRSYSLSSGASTESLVSVLDHDSYESLGAATDDDEGNAGQRRKQSSQVQFSAQDTTFTTSTAPTGPPASPGKTSASLQWETWMVIKAKEARLKQKQQNQQVQKVQDEEKRKQEEKLQKQKIAELKIKEWAEKKELSEKINRKLKIRQERSKQEIEAMKKEEVRQKANRKFEEWKEKKKMEEADEKRILKEKKKKEEEEKDERRKKCQEEFEKWCKNVQKKPKSVHSSLGYTSGKLTGYYDTNAYPVPTFYNPRPWVPNDVPTTKQPKKRAKSARRWNPDKYF